MTKKELISLLEQYPDDTRVVVDSLHGGLFDMDTVEETEIYLNYTDGSFFGPHQRVKYAYRLDNDKFEKVSAIYLT